jgi:hypothetical protein
LLLSSHAAEKGPSALTSISNFEIRISGPRAAQLDLFEQRAEHVRTVLQISIYFVALGRVVI